MTILTRTQLSQISNRTIKLEVRTDDLGNENQAKARLFDKKGHVVDVPLVWKGKAGPKGTDDDFAREITTQELPAGFDLASASATSFVTFPNTEFKLWEGLNHAIKPLSADATVDQPISTNTIVKTRSAQLLSGKLELTTAINPKTGYKSAYGQGSVTGISFEDTTNFFKGAQQLKIVLIPVVDVSDRRPINGDFWHADYVEKELVEKNDMNVVTLVRQADGRYRADAGAGKAFVSESTASEYYGSRSDFSHLMVALVDPATNKWDSNGGRDYAVSMPPT